MTVRSRILASVNSPPPQSTSSTSSPSPPIETLDSNFIVILAALLCVLICVLGLVAIARCSWIRRLSTANTHQLISGNTGLKKKVLNSLPKLTYNDGIEQVANLLDCAICLEDFAGGDEIRVLPQCGHGFHVGCIDTWLGSHSSCPSCRQILVMARCQKCGGTRSATGCAAPGEIQPEPRENHVNSFLP